MGYIILCGSTCYQFYKTKRMNCTEKWLTPKLLQPVLLNVQLVAQDEQSAGVISKIQKLELFLCYLLDYSLLAY